MDPKQRAEWSLRLGISPDRADLLDQLWDAARASAGGGHTTLRVVAPEGSAEATSPFLFDSVEAAPTEPTAPGAGGAASDRYARLSMLGEGGMGQVWRVRDRALNRTVAMKVLRPELARAPSARSRFVDEAWCSGQLQHPGIVPVHELGTLASGELYFTMREVRGRTLTEVISEVHAASPGPQWREAPSGWTFRRLVEALRRVCEAVAYAHTRGVIHRDLKPENVLLGAHGEVLVVDWGLAKVVGAPERPLPGATEAVVTGRSVDPSLATRIGAVAGTPAYMAPEQARGEVARLDARVDVYALGAMLYEVLSGRPPYSRRDGADVVARVVAGPPLPPGRLAADRSAVDPAGPPLPPELVAAVRRAMARDPADRFPDAGALAAEVGAWLEGARRREQALSVVTAALEREPEASALRARAAALRADAAQALAAVPSWAPAAEKAGAWALEDEAADLEWRAERAALRAMQGLAGALRIDPTLPEAHAALAQRHRAAHAVAEAARDAAARERAALAVQEHAAALPPAHPVRAACEAYLTGDGALSLVTEPPGAEVLLFREVVQDRRLVPVFERSLGVTPLQAAPLPMGSYRCVLRHPDCEEVVYPVALRRQEHWDGVAPGETEPTPVPLPPRGSLGPDDCYVPPGWFASGGDPEAADTLPGRRLWCDGRVVRRFPITNREYLAFLDDLVARGQEQAALRHAPRERAGKPGALGALIFGRREDGRFYLKPDAEGDVWLDRAPVLQVDWDAAEAYCRWLADRTGQPWRLPSSLEREKAARGVDGRFYPWGDHHDPSWSCSRGSHAGVPLPASVDDYPLDQSVYGVRGLGGNVRDWCQERHGAGGPPVEGLRVVIPPDDRSLTEHPDRVTCGGDWLGPAEYARSASRVWCAAWLRNPYVSFRPVRSWPTP